MAQQLRALRALAEVQGSVPSTHTRRFTELSVAPAPLDSSGNCTHEPSP